MLHPIQRIHLHLPSDRLYTATSNSLHVFSLSSGELLSTWAAPPSPPTTAPDSQQPASKKRKLNASAPTRPSRWSNASVSTNNAILRLLLSPDGHHIVLATAEDKCVRVFSSPELTLLSSRVLPKRIADVVVTDEGRLLVGDKHGDVFELPLVGADAVPLGGGGKKGGLSISEEEAEAKRKRTEIDYGLSYEHRFVLGHVSMLLKIAVVDGRWIVTSDRDEHIRVSRYPEAFVIERFLLGHESFVSSLLVVAGDLVSGGGDPYLLVWEWKEGTAKQRIEIEGGGGKPVVTGLWGLPFLNAILVAVEKSEWIRMFVRNPDGVWEKGRDIELQAPVLDVVVAGHEVYVTVDTQDPKELLKVMKWGDDGWTAVGDSAVVKAIAEGSTKVDVPEHLEDAVKANVLYATASLRKEILERDFRNAGRDGDDEEEGDGEGEGIEEY